MSEYDDPDFDDNEDDAPPAEANGPKALRQALAKAKKELAETLKERDALRAANRQRDVADALETHGAPKRLAKYVDVEDASPDGVLAWLRENGEDFGWAPADEPDEEEAHNRVQAQRASRASQQAPEGKIENFEEQMAKAKTPQELREVYARMGAA